MVLGVQVCGYYSASLKQWENARIGAAESLR